MRTRAGSARFDGGGHGRSHAQGVSPDVGARQPAGYLRNHMLLFKSDQRNPNDLALKALRALFQMLADEEIADLAAYSSSLR